VKTCKEECETTGGAIFCDGEFLHASNIEDCAAALAAKIDVHVDLDLSINADVDVDVGGGKDNDKDDAEDKADSVADEVDDACSVATAGSAHSPERRAPLAVLSLAALGLTVLRRRGAKAKQSAQRE
jgi:hypothetical protein